MDYQPWWKSQNKETGEQKKSKLPSAGKIKKIIIIVLLAAVVILGVATSFYTVNDKQQAVITTFGRVTGVSDPGIHFKIPFGIQKATNVDVNVYRKIEIGYRSQENNSALAADTVAIEEESKMISSDSNIVNCDFFLEYKVSDPVKFLYNSQNPDQILKSLAQSHIRDVISSYPVDAILTSGKNEIQMKIKEGIVKELDVYDIGLVLTDIKMQDSEPPTQRVIEAFKDVETAKQEKETAINIALAYENSEKERVDAETQKIKNEAELWAQSRKNEAEMQVAMFNAMYEEYSKDPDVTKKRMFFEMIEEVLPDAKVYIDTSSDSSTQKLLPIDSFNK